MDNSQKPKKIRCQVCKKKLGISYYASANYISVQNIEHQRIIIVLITLRKLVVKYLRKFSKVVNEKIRHI